MRGLIIAVGLGVLCGGVGPAQGGYQIHWVTHSSPADNGRSRAAFEKSLEITRAQAAFSSAYCIAQRSLPLNAEIDQARDTLRSAYRAYQTVVSDAKADLEKRPDIREQLFRIRQNERQLDAVKDASSHFELAGELMKLRSALSSAESDVMSADPDITVAKAQYVQAAQQLAGLQQRQAAMVLEDEQVAAAKQRLDQLRRELAFGG